MGSTRQHAHNSDAVINISFSLANPDNVGTIKMGGCFFIGVSLIDSNYERWKGFFCLFSRFLLCSLIAMMFRKPPKES